MQVNVLPNHTKFLKEILGVDIKPGLVNFSLRQAILLIDSVPVENEYLYKQLDRELKSVGR